MIIRADTNDGNKVPKVGDVFVVKNVEKIAAFWIIELGSSSVGSSSEELKKAP